VVVGIETDRGLWVGALIAAGYQMYAVNPLAVARYRDRHHVSGAKSDASDAKLLADLMRTDRHNHRPVAGDSSQAEAIKVLARAHQSLIWTRTRHTNALRSALREYYPAALVAFEDLAHGDALGILGRAPTPEQGAHLDLPAIQSALKRGGRQRNIAARARQIRAALRTGQLAEAGFGGQCFGLGQAGSFQERGDRAGLAGGQAPRTLAAAVAGRRARAAGAVAASVPSVCQGLSRPMASAQYRQRDWRSRSLPRVNGR
jgi:hypothetical protein